MCDDIRPPKIDRRRLKLCVECKTRKCEDPEDEICAVCWEKPIEAARKLRLERIAAGWTVNAHGGIHPPNCRLLKELKSTQPTAGIPSVCQTPPPTQ